ncbi:MAG: hypothetical protein N4J56_004590 [Chroococcidiopsis sp. SAG 2025]|uniref:hypothetical protein n=1 Tax=Chroococcidiopsis sp. SAG 2025 TaxID=171389 RepID=UPI002937147D|nr:hypothetical protein [Chroococcidiopsis sp. SAG 2025]MDV2994936.1 hypothetical protein [Chroococcidiopsis sp. SAG 2025]
MELDSARRETKQIGENNYEIQQELIVTAARLTARFIEELLSKIKGRMQDKNAPLKLSIQLGDKTLEEETANSKTAASESLMLSKQDIDYLRTAIATPASTQKHPHLDRNVSISVNGREILSVKNGVVKRNELASPTKEAEAEVEPTPERSPQIAADSPAKESSAVPSTIDVDARTVVEPEGAKENSAVGTTPTQVLEKEKTQQTQSAKTPRTEAEPTPSSSVIIILNRELQNRVPQGRSRDHLLNAVQSWAKAPRNLIRQVSSAFSQARQQLLSKFAQPETPLSRDLRNLAAVSTADRLLTQHGTKTADGTEVLEGNVYRFERSPQSLTVTAKDGRGTILEQRDGAIAGNLSPDDVARFHTIDSSLSASIARERSPQIEPELG